MSEAGNNMGSKLAGDSGRGVAEFEVKLGRFLRGLP